MFPQSYKPFRSSLVIYFEGATFGIQFHFRQSCQSPRGRDVYHHYRQPSGDFRQYQQICQNCHFRQNRQPPKGHFWHPIFKSPEAGDFSPVSPFSPLHAFLAIFANFATIAIFAKVASLQGSRRFIAITTSPLAIFAKITIYAKIASLQGDTFGIQFKSPEAGDFSPVSPFCHCVHFWT